MLREETWMAAHNLLLIYFCFFPLVVETHEFSADLGTSSSLQIIQHTPFPRQINVFPLACFLPHRLSSLCDGHHSLYQPTHCFSQHTCRLLVVCGMSVRLVDKWF
jgi:hypothetical protein